MIAQPRVSVIIPAYNHACYLPAALDSVIAQSVEEWEAIVVDDGSTDETAEVAAGFTDPRIRYLYQTNQGSSAARNAGIRAARGCYLVFLDADDELTPPFMERCLQELERDPDLDGVYSLNYFIDPQGVRLPRLGGRVVARNRLADQLLEGGFFAIHSAMIRKTSLPSDAHFPQTPKTLEDWSFWLRFSHDHTMIGIPDPLVSYRIHAAHPQSTSKSLVAADIRLTNRIKLLSEFLGSPEGDPASWHAAKRRAFGFAHRQATLDHLLRQESIQGWSRLGQAFIIWPHLIDRLDTYFELICAEQSLGNRGQAELLDLPQRAAEVVGQLQNLFDGDLLQLAHKRGVALGNAYLALAMLSDQAGDWSAARRYLCNALRAHPGLLRDRSVTRRLIKLSLGQRTANRLRRVRPEAVGHSAR
ncbi:MAG: glycosyltransferase family 2 protein [Caldilineaceae bacterium]|nr:glycosyltransferase family 2 protein [Caldilineaceae bacterium]